MAPAASKQSIPSHYSFMLKFLRPSSPYRRSLLLRPMSNAASQVAMGPLATAVHDKLSAAFTPLQLEVVNESYKHNVPAGSESHFKVLVVSTLFEGTKPLARHRMINSVLELELKTIHALSIQARTPDQWAADSTISGTPPCLGGGKH